MWPNGKISQNVGPTSPPETPRTASPVFGRKSSPPPSGVSAPTPPPLPHSRHHHHHHHNHLRPMAPPPLSTGGVPMAFNGGRPDQLSPRTTSCSSSSSSEDESDNDSQPAGPSRSATPEQPQLEPSPLLPQIPHISARIGRSTSITIGRVIAETDSNFVIEELSDFADSDDERDGVLRPDYIEYAESNRSRSRSRTRRPAVIDRTFIFSLHNLNCDDESDETDLDEAEYREFLIKRREEKKKRRMTSGSIGKRTISESIGSDTDLEDLKPWLGPNSSEDQTGGRRMRRRVSMVDHHMRRRSSIFQHEARTSRIEELDEPESDDGVFLEVGGVGEKLARELPYYEYVSMEVDSP
ncbi:uncharacterized protein PODANS_5_9430 [Podospora anserina S mat+]|uniref:Podospora anserina S mat+ genomic DNA chromosome 5, supercontig 9 n=1 Tax=Podospora anserina (strain S / ATCC MYA-4624 / DSM 980 / FGSC 10383) TaxID=515849 RepID=B2AKZ8_PODAN|nr:uncharacterized protein PODANS_5_9430 [Podospora anserina S mat+]CAP64670.1 unnamed protein product [Podospora anserina S mat+]CDP30066.1 Putative protein of unknown function [Podospora anserina S mat+]